MRRTPLVVTVLVSAVLGVVLAVLAPAAAASDEDGSPRNRGWVADHGSDSGDSGGSDSDSDSDD